jgi:hypothetical protein
MASTLAVPASPRSTTSLLESLPNELLSRITETCDVQHIAKLVQCNKSLYARLYPVLIAAEVNLHSGVAVIYAASRDRLDLLKELHQRGVSVTQRWGCDEDDEEGIR